MSKPTKAGIEDLKRKLGIQKNLNLGLIEDLSASRREVSLLKSTNKRLTTKIQGHGNNGDYGV